MHHVKTGVAYAHFAENGVHVGPVVVEQGVDLAQFLDNGREFGFHETQRIGAGHHEARHFVGILGNGFGQGFGVHHAVAGFDIDGFKTGKSGGGGIGAVGRVGDQHLGAMASLGAMVGGDELHAGKFAVGPRHRLECVGLHARDFAEPLLGFVEALERPLGVGRGAGQLREQRMQTRKTGQAAHVLAEFGVVLHGAGAKGVEIGVHAVVELGKTGKVTHHVQLGALGQARRILAQQLGGQHVRGPGGVFIHGHGITGGPAAFYGFGENGFHSSAPMLSARKPI